MRWTELPIWRIGWLERAFYKASKRRAVVPALRLFDSSWFGWDISYYQGAVNFQKMKNYGTKFLIVRCGYAGVKDTRFDEYMIMSDGLLPVSVYHYYDPLVSPVVQANKVLESIAPYKNRIRRVWGDLEFPWSGAYQDPKHWQTYRGIIKAAGYKFGWYTRATWWDSRVGTYAVEFADDPVWAAQYNTSLNLIPKGWTKAHIWQQGTPAIGLAVGVSSKEIDYDLWNTDFNFAEEWGTASPPPPPPVETITTPYEGVKHYEGVKNGWKYFLQEIDPAKVRYEFYDSTTRETVSSVAKREGAQIATNGGEWNRVAGEPTDYEFAPRLILMDDGTIWINHVDVTGQAAYITGLRYLIRGGVLQAYLSGAEPQYTEGHSRTIEGLKADGTHIQMVSEGAYPNQGLTLKQAAEVMQAHGAVIAFDSGGGGDSTLYMGGRVLNVTEDISNGVHMERAIPEVVLIFTKEANMANGTAKEALGNVTTKRNKPSRYGVSVGSFSAYSTVEFTEVVDAVVSGSADLAADKWLKLPDGNYINYILAGKTYYNILTQPTTPPPPVTDSIEVKITENGVTKTYKVIGEVTVT